MIIFSIGFFVITLVILCFVFSVNPFKWLLSIFQSILNYEPKGKNKTLKEIIDENNGKKRTNMMKRALDEADMSLKEQNDGDSTQIKTTKKMCMVLAFVGLGIGLCLGNFFLAPVLMVTFYCVPLWLVKKRALEYKKGVNAEIETALSLITTTYLRTDNFVNAVSENIKYIENPVKKYFTVFLADVNYIDSDITAALLVLKNSVQNTVFKEWVTNVIKCQVNGDMKSVLLPIVEKFSSVREVQLEYDNAMRMVMMDHLMLTALVVAMIPFMFLLNKEWFFILFTTFQGKLITAVIAVVALLGINKSIDLMKPIDY